jgi:hypothetical protein
MLTPGLLDLLHLNSLSFHDSSSISLESSLSRGLGRGGRESCFLVVVETIDDKFSLLRLLGAETPITGQTSNSPPLSDTPSRVFRRT